MDFTFSTGFCIRLYSVFWICLPFLLGDSQFLACCYSVTFSSDPLLLTIILSC